VKKNFTIKNNISSFFLPEKRIKNNNLIISNKLNNIFKEINKKKDTFHILSKKYKFSFNNQSLKKFRKFKKIIVIGMGGSILGSKAIYSFLGHKINKDFIFFDNLSEANFKDFKSKKKKDSSLFIIVSKSGNTIETLININLLKKTDLNHLNTIMITEKNNNALNNICKKKKILTIEHKNYIGGRYSVLSEVGMIPAYLMGLKIKNFRKDILDYFKKKKKKSLIENASKLTEIYLHKQINSIIFFNYSPQLLDFNYWCQQLLAESLGKKGKGLLPLISSAPKDHHSLLQLYLDGPKDKIFYIISSKNFYDLKIKGEYLDNKFKFLKNQKLNKIILSQKKAFIEVLKKKNIPYREIHVNDFSERALGELFSYFMLETAMIAKLINVNPFDQPSVEEVKVLTKKFLC
tara:strand:+ start:251 stop:1465 length:1215 start_codon:yes stop_codon:yes gene_type:complete